MKIISTLRCMAFTIVVGGIVNSAYGESHSRGAVVIRCTCDDEVGRSYKAALLMALAQNGVRWRVAEGRSDGPVSLNVSIVSRRLESTASGNSRSAVSVAYDGDGTRVEQEIESCDQLPLQESVRAALDEFKPLFANKEQRPATRHQAP